MDQIKKTKTIQEPPKKEISIDFMTGFKIEGLTNIIESSDTNIIAQLGPKKVLEIQGEDLSIEELKLDIFFASILGKIKSLKYKDKDKTKSFFKNIFK